MLYLKSLTHLEPPSQPLVDKFIDLIVDIQQIPAPTFDESRRAQFIYEQFNRTNLKQVMIDDVGNVHATRPGLDPSAKPILVTGHLDTVFPIDTDLSVRRIENQIHGPGIGDNSTSVAALLAIHWLLEEQNLLLPNDVIFVANVGEEGLGDLKGMRAVIDQYEDDIHAVIVMEGIGLGRVYRQAIGSKRFRVSTQATGGHSWGDFPSPSAIHKLMHIGAALANLKVPAYPKTTFNIGVIEGGTSINTIAEHASLLLDLRSASPAELDDLVQQAISIIKNFDNAQVPVTITPIGDRPAGSIAADHPLVELALYVLQSLGYEQPRLAMGSTDANIPLSQDIPAVCIGLTDGANAHRHDEYITTPPLAMGLHQATMLIANACMI